jgi:tRNA G18 (ribose-2'-O)-methylase SpoU
MIRESKNRKHIKFRKLTPDEIFERQPKLYELKQRDRTPVYALIEDIRSMHNVGSIFRTSDGMGLSKLFLCGYTAKPPRMEIDKTALGATESVPWEYIKNPIDLINRLKKEGVRVVAVEHTDKSVDYADMEYIFPVCFVFGNEVEGVSEDIISRADQVIELPMMGIKHSLNVSVAYGIVMYSAMSQYEKLKSVTA